MMGIVNINDDSFCRDGSIDPDWALKHCKELVELGADIIDLGAESARTNRAPIPEEEEVRRLLPVVKGFSELEKLARRRASEQVFPPILSINTWRSGVIQEVLPHGGDIINDMSGLPDATNAAICAKFGCSLLIMHSVGAPKEKHTHVRYDDIVTSVREFFEKKILLAMSTGLTGSQIILDPGIDFAKPASDNLRLIRELSSLTSLGHPVLLPVSRKSTIRKVTGATNPLDRDPGTASLMVAGVQRGAAILRLHNVDLGWRIRETLSQFAAH